SIEVGTTGDILKNDCYEILCLHQLPSSILAIPYVISSDLGGMILHGFQPRNGSRQWCALLLCKGGMCGERCATGDRSSLNEATSRKHQSSWSKRLSL